MLTLKDWIRQASSEAPGKDSAPLLSVIHSPTRPRWRVKGIRGVKQHHRYLAEKSSHVNHSSQDKMALVETAYIYVSTLMSQSHFLSLGSLLPLPLPGKVCTGGQKNGKRSSEKPGGWRIHNWANRWIFIRSNRTSWRTALQQDTGEGRRLHFKEPFHNTHNGFLPFPYI